jgi:hypothetical protein
MQKFIFWCLRPVSVEPPTAGQIPGLRACADLKKRLMGAISPLLKKTPVRTGREGRAELNWTSRGSEQPPPAKTPNIRTFAFLSI